MAVYMERVRLVLSMLEAVKTDNFLLYAASINQMSPLFFSFDGQNYARYLTYGVSKALHACDDVYLEADDASNVLYTEMI